MQDLIKIQQELKAPKNQRNNFGNYNYRSCEDILEAVKPLLAKHNCLLTLTDKMVEVGGRVYVEATAEFASEGFQTTVKAYAREAESKKGMDDSQITGAASSYARKYALNGLFCIDDTKDADTQKPPEDTKKEKGDLVKTLETLKECTSKQSIEMLSKQCAKVEWTPEETAKLQKAFKEKRDATAN
jgi:hypothetical protein